LGLYTGPTPIKQKKNFWGHFIFWLLLEYQKLAALFRTADFFMKEFSFNQAPMKMKSKVKFIFRAERFINKMKIGHTRDSKPRIKQSDRGY